MIKCDVTRPKTALLSNDIVMIYANRRSYIICTHTVTHYYTLAALRFIRKGIV